MAKADDGVFYALVVSLAIFGLVTVAVVAPFYIFATTLDAAEKVAAFRTRS